MTGCLWCGAPFGPRRDGGRAQRFCCPHHRRAFDHAARAYVMLAVETGTMTRAELRQATQSNAALLTEVLRDRAATGVADDDESTPPTLQERRAAVARLAPYPRVTLVRGN